MHLGVDALKPSKQDLQAWASSYEFVGRGGVVSLIAAPGKDRRLRLAAYVTRRDPLTANEAAWFTVAPAPLTVKGARS